MRVARFFLGSSEDVAAPESSSAVVADAVASGCAPSAVAFVARRR